jgi:molybdate transport system regulatory protein
VRGTVVAELPRPEQHQLVGTRPSRAATTMMAPSNAKNTLSMSGFLLSWMARGIYSAPVGDTLPPVAKLTIRIDLSSHGAIGPGKIRLLELVGESGSISAAGRAMNMSYRRAWMLIDGLNRCFRVPVVETQSGGTRGGGAVLTELGHDVIAHYRAIERAATKAAAAELTALDAQSSPRAAAGGARRLVASAPRRRSSLMPRRARG